MTAESRRRALDALATFARSAERQLDLVYEAAVTSQDEDATPEDIKAAMTTERGGVLLALTRPVDGAPEAAGEFEVRRAALMAAATAFRRDSDVPDWKTREAMIVDRARRFEPYLRGEVR